MNPLDSSELFEIINIINTEMPIHTDFNVKIPNTLYGYLPKNLMLYSDKVDNRFLNKYQNIFEEIKYREPNNKFINDFIKYQKKYFINAIGHDSSFFKIDLPRELYKNHGICNVGFLGGLKLLGQVITSDTNNLTGTGWSNDLWCAKATQGTQVIGSYYDQIALDINTAAGNIRLGVYNGATGGNPTNLYAETASIASPSSGTFAFQSITEFKLTDTSTWLAFQTDSASLNIKYLNSGTNSWSFVFTYGAFQNPRTSANLGNAATPHLKAGHT